MKSNFAKSLFLVRLKEGGNDDDKDDPGGRTSRGVIQREWDAYRKQNPEKILPEDVWEAPDVDINAIYWESYWLPWGELPCFRLGIDYSYFDMRVHHGDYWATRLLQRALAVKDDGAVGIVTKTALLNSDSEQLLHEIHDRRALYMRKLYWYRKYGHGWLDRNDFVLRRALLMVRQPALMAA